MKKLEEDFAAYLCNNCKKEFELDNSILKKGDIVACEKCKQLYEVNIHNNILYLHNHKILPPI